MCEQLKIYACDWDGFVLTFQKSNITKGKIMKKTSLLNRFCLGALAVIAVSGAAEAQVGSQGMANEIAALRDDLQILQRQVYRSNNDIAPTSAADVAVKMGEFDEQLRRAMGRVDELEYKIKLLEDKMAVMNRDIDVRFSMIEGKPVNGGHMAMQDKPKFDAKVAQGAPKSIVGDAVDAGNDLAPVKSQSVEEMYQAGLDALKSADYVTADQKFNSILKRYPNDKLAGNAQYWLGEVYYVKKDWQRAAIAFAKGLEKYKNGPKGPDSLLKLGLSLRELNKKNEACQSFTTMKTEFPKAEKSMLERAAEEARKLGCK